MAIKASPATGNINASGRVTAAEFAAQSVSAFRVGSGALVEQTMPMTESSSKPISITGIVQWVRGLIGSFYTKPSGGIPKSDLVSSVQTSLNKADAAQPKIDDLNTIRERARTGNEHAGIKDGNPHNTKFSDLVEKPTTLTGYGVTAADPATVSAEGGADDNKAADAVKTKQYVEYMVGSNTARFQGEFATVDDIPTDVTEYATKTAPTNNDYIVVRDMSEYGKTGNLFSAIDAEVGSINANGVIDTAMTNFRHTTLLPLSGKDGWHIHLKATGVGGSAMFRLHAYKSDGSWNGQIAVAQSAGGMVELRGLVPYGTNGFRVSYLNGSSVTVFAHEREGSWRWIYTGEWSTVGKNGWSPAFQMSSEPFTPAQMAALNSGATEEKILAIESKQDALTPAQLTNIDAVPQKRDKSDMFTEWDAGGFPDVIGQPVYDESTKKWYWETINVGVTAEASDETGESVELEFRVVCEGGSEYDFTATRQRILTTDDVTDDLTDPTEGKAAEAEAVKTALERKAASSMYIGFKGRDKPTVKVVFDVTEESQIVDGTEAKIYEGDNLLLTTTVNIDEHGGMYLDYERDSIVLSDGDTIEYIYKVTDGFWDISYNQGTHLDNDLPLIGITPTGRAAEADGLTESAKAALNIPTITTVIASSSSGKAAEAAAVAAAITDATKLTPVFAWSFSGDGVSRYSNLSAYIEELNDNTGAFWLTDDGVEVGYATISLPYDGSPIRDLEDVGGHDASDITAGSIVVGYKLGAKTAETDPTLNGMSVAQISSIAEAAVDDKLPIALEAKTASFEAEDGKRYTVAAMPATLAVTLPNYTGDAAKVAHIFEARFDGSALTADASVTFAGATATTMDTDCGTVKSGKVALMSAFWNGATWDISWKNQG